MTKEEYIKKYGDIPPPWIYCPTCHPYSIGWRMGDGETHITILSEWLEEQKLSFEDKIMYLKKYPAPPRWYAWITDFLWEIDDTHFEIQDYQPYFEKLEKLGFDNLSSFEEDFNNAKWD